MRVRENSGSRVSRRLWAKLALAGAAGVGIGTREESAFAQETGERCRLAIGTYGMPELELEAAIDLIAETGFDGIEITVLPGSSGDPDRLDAGRRADLRKRMEDRGLRLEALMGGFDPEPEAARHAEQLERLRAVMELARDLGGPDRPPLIQTVLGGRDSGEGPPPHFLERLAGWMPLAADFKVPMAIKPHRSHALSIPEQAIALLRELGESRWMGMVYDYSHYAFRGMDLRETIETSLPWVSYVAVKDAVEREGRVEFALAGSTESWDQAEVVGAFQEGGYRGAFCCEVSSQIWKKDPDYDAVAVTRQCYAAMADAFQRAGVTN